MPELRWILIGFAIVLLAGIYLWGRRNSVRDSERESVQRSRPEPTLFDGTLDANTSGEGYDQSPPSSARLGDIPEEHLDITAERRIESTQRASRTVESEDALASSHLAPASGTRRARTEPTLVDTNTTAELPVEESFEPESTASESAPTLSSSETPAPRRSERRKILSLRLAASPHKIEGSRLLEAFQTEALRHGKYEIYHRLHEDGASVFSVASMIEPGTFDPEKMPQAQYPGITMFAQLPGPVPGMHALNELVACARRLQQSLGGTLQDDRGVPLTVHRIERMRQEVREFERPPQSSQRGTPSSTRY